MDVMMRRREIIAADGVGYIRDGLVLWMDGINKGTVSGAWVDRTAGHVFESINGFTNGANYVGLSRSSSQYFRNATFTGPAEKEPTTIEVAISDYLGSSMAFMPRGTSVAFGVMSSAKGAIWTSHDWATYAINFPAGSKLFSINSDTVIVDGNKITSFGASEWWTGEDSYNYIGRRSTGTYFDGKIYSIRIYNRILSQAEMLHNQRIDIKRYNIGIII